MNKVTVTEAQGYELMAHICHKLKVPVPGPAAGIQVVGVIEAVKQAMEKVHDKQAAMGLRFYLDALQFVAGIWAYQQKLVIEDLETLVKATEPEAHP